MHFDARDDAAQDQGRVIRALARAAALAAMILGGCSDDTGPLPQDSRAPDAALDHGPTAEHSAPDASTPQELIILHTNDLHSSVEGFSPVSEYTPGTTGDDGTLGGFARLAAVIKNERAAAGSTPVLLLDAGDFMQGSLFGWLGTIKAVELTLMGQMGYDATTLGNHEFDWRPAGLAAVINAAVADGFKVPIMVPVNLKFDSTSPDDDALEALQTAGVLQTKLIKTVGGLKVGIFGLMGKDAATDALMYGASPVSFGDRIAAAQAMVKELRETDKVGLVICLSHGGSHADGTGEDVDLAKQVTGIDVIISGHTHDAISTPLQVGSTIVAQAGYWSRNLGKLQLKVDAGAVTLTKGELLTVDDTVKGDDAVQTAVTGYIGDIDSLLKAGGSSLTYKQVIAQTGFDLTFPEYQEALMGDLVVDGYLSAVKALQPTEPPDLAVESNGVIGNPTLKGKNGKLWFADVFHAVQAGIGPDQKPGYPLVAFYLNGADLKAGMEVLAAAKGLLGSNSYFFQVAGMSVEYQASGFPLSSVTSIKVGDPPVEVNLTDTTTCYKMVTSLLVALQLAQVSQLTGGLLSIQPKEKDCTTAITDVTTKIVDRDPATAGLQELKAWQAVVGYMQSFPDTNGDGTPDVPAAYQTVQGRIVAK